MTEQNNLVRRALSKLFRCYVIVDPFSNELDIISPRWVLYGWLDLLAAGLIFVEWNELMARNYHDDALLREPVADVGPVL